MPKIIENIRGQLLTEAKRQIAEYGYANTTIRSVASACGVGIGTVYNYFPSKDILVATFMLEEWKLQLEVMAALPADEPDTLLCGIYEALLQFITANEKLFSDETAAKLIASGSAVRHKMLRGQIAAFLLPLCEKSAVENVAFNADFLAEALIGWAMERTPFDLVGPILKKVIKK